MLFLILYALNLLTLLAASVLLVLRIHQSGETAIDRLWQLTESETSYLFKTLKDKGNFLFLGFSFLFIAVYKFARFTGEREEDMAPNIMSPDLTVWLQKFLGTRGWIAEFLSYYYVYWQLVTIVCVYFIVYYSARGRKGRPAWLYAFTVLTCLFINYPLIWLFFPVAPPVRFPALGIETEAVQVREHYLPWSEELISANYSALPSGHMIVIFSGYFVAREEGFEDAKWFFLLGSLLMTLTVVYLGDHYLIDVLGSFVLVPTVLFPATYFYDRFQAWRAAPRHSFPKTLSNPALTEERLLGRIVFVTGVLAVFMLLPQVAFSHIAPVSPFYLVPLTLFAVAIFIFLLVAIRRYFLNRTKTESASSSTKVSPTSSD
ncbi:MAG: phosphatase PAP2 family protein [Candidatus Hodarchaeota archaeon]